MSYDYSKWIDRLLSCTKEPPEAFKELCLRKAREFYSVDEPSWVQDPQDGSWLLTAKRMASPMSQAGEACRNLFEGLYEGYCLALGPVKPYFVDAPNVTWRRHGGGGYSLPKFGKVVRHWFATWGEADEFAKAACKEYSDKADHLYEIRHEIFLPLNFEWHLSLEAKYDADKVVHF